MVKRKEAAWKEVLGARDEATKDVWKLTKKKRERLKVYISEQEKVNEKFGSRCE